MPDVPIQYKALVDEVTLALVDVGALILPILGELGGESFTVEGNGVRVTVTKGAS